MIRYPLCISCFVFFALRSHLGNLETIQELGYQGAEKEVISQTTVMGKGTRIYSSKYRRLLQADVGYSPFGLGGFHPYDLCSNNTIHCFDSRGHYDDLHKPTEVTNMGLGAVLVENNGRKAQITY